MVEKIGVAVWSFENGILFIRFVVRLFLRIASLEIRGSEMAVQLQLQGATIWLAMRLIVPGKMVVNGEMPICQVSVIRVKSMDLVACEAQGKCRVQVLIKLSITDSRCPLLYHLIVL